MDFLTAQKGFSQQSRAKVTQLCSSKPGCGSERAEFLGCRLPWVILATQGSFFPVLKSSLLIPRAGILHGHLNTGFEARAARRQSPKGQRKARLNPTAAPVCPSTQSRAWHRPSHQTHQQPVLGTPPLRYFQKEKTSGCPQGLNVLNEKEVLLPLKNNSLWTPLRSVVGAWMHFLPRKKAERREAELWLSHHCVCRGNYCSRWGPGDTHPKTGWVSARNEHHFYIESGGKFSIKHGVSGFMGKPWWKWNGFGKL